MNEVWNRLESSATGKVFCRGGTPVATVVDRLEGTESPRDVAASLGLDATDLIAALAFAGLGDDETGGPPLVQAAPRRPRLLLALSEPAWAAALPGTSRIGRLALSAGLLQIHDFWDASHEAAQAADDLGEADVSAYWQGIAHRREPDAGNATYWFRRVGPSAVFPVIADLAGPVLAEWGDPKLTERLLSGGRWNPFAFIELCSSARHATDLAHLARAIQRLEMLALLEHSVSVLGAGR
jgi:pimeloyl-ACP methyl ester carboxylesterase